MSENSEWNFLEWLQGIIAKDDEIEALERLWNLPAAEQSGRDEG